MRKHILTYRVTTPAFIGGSDQQAEFRIASFKGILRFWWRALQWGRFTSSQALKAEEDSIFGSSDQSVGQSKVKLRLIETGAKPKQNAVNAVLWQDDDPNCSQGNTQRPGAFYLGYGCINAFATKDGKKAGQLLRACLSPFSFHLEVRMTCDDAKCESVEQALAVIGLLGGLGAKSRKGFGSLNLVDWSNASRPCWLDLQSPHLSLNTILKQCGAIAKSIPDWTAFASDTRIIKLDLADPKSNERDLLDAIGRQLMYFRSWGRGGKLNFGASETRFWQDHDLYKAECCGGSGLSGRKTVTISHPQRIAFGLPHNYGKKPNEHVFPLLGGNEQESRRASPLFIHIHQPDVTKPPSGYIAFFPTQFLPTGTQINSFGKPVTLSGTTTLYSPIKDFLDRLEGIGAPDNVIKTDIKGTIKGTKVL